jgi:Fur family ferric uptake transcriptional regulator
VSEKTNLPSGLKKTKQRERALAALEKSARPMSAPEIYAAIAKDGDAIWMSTVYRILDLLVRKGAVTKINMPGSDAAFYELNRPRHKHYAVCLACHKVIDLDDDCPLEGYVPKLSDKDFQITGHNLEVFGYCGDCKRP